MPDNYGEWQTAAQLGSTALSTMAQANLNKKTRKWNEEQYRKQRADALADWQMQNDYNSPAAQMERLKAAKLNPNLIYGKGAGDMTAAPVRSTDTKSWDPKAPDYSGVGNSVMTYLDAKMKDAQIDNLRAQNTAIVNESLLKEAQRYRTNVETMRGGVALKYDDERLRLDNRLKDISYDVSVNQISQMMNKWQLDQEQLEIIRATKPATIQLAVERILNMQMERSKDEQEINRIKQHIEVLRNSTTLQDLEINLKRRGLTWSDALWQRIAATILNEF